MLNFFFLFCLSRTQHSPNVISKLCKITHWRMTSSLCRNSKYNQWLWLCFSSDMTCVSECPAGTYGAWQVADGTELGYCLPCDRACSSCTGASRQDCLTCSPGYLRLLELCVTHCPTGYKAASCLFTLPLLKKKTSVMNYEVLYTPLSTHSTMCGNIFVCLVSL